MCFALLCFINLEETFEHISFKNCFFAGCAIFSRDGTRRFQWISLPWTMVTTENEKLENCLHLQRSYKTWDFVPMDQIFKTFTISQLSWKCFEFTDSFDYILYKRLHWNKGSITFTDWHMGFRIPLKLTSKTLLCRFSFDVENVEHEMTGPEVIFSWPYQTCLFVQVKIPSKFQ